ncbi:hypothetical protein [Spiroplasma endosymbiont of Phyllotreta cruciferae]|uniref:hypothetical protein n=1 Tax=Spiroplasma endosymbiont of Phyllotreta cruciferae TaxID=2886375 RepID=UPI00209FBA60|nr:hypothetical protein [Spiroplasma endosymbiont of Phyllotreta cruciferae]
MQDLLDEIKMKIRTMQDTLIQLNEYEIHHESIKHYSKRNEFLSAYCRRIRKQTY